LIADFLFSMIKLKYEADNQFSMEPLPQVEEVEARDKKSKRLAYSHTATSYRPWMLLQGLVILRSSSLIRQIDAENNRSVSALLKKIKEAPSVAVQCSPDRLATQIDPSHPVYGVITHLFPALQPDRIIGDILPVCVTILDTVIRKSEKNIPLDMKNLAYRISQYCGEQGNAIQRFHDECLFWCFLFPLLNLVTIITRKRSAMPPNNFAAYLACFFFIREAALRDTSLFLVISTEHQEIMNRLHQQFLQIVALLEQYEHKSLADKVLSMNTTADEEKSQQLLIESVNDHFYDIYEELAQDPTSHEKLLTRLAPFAELGFKEEIFQ